ncbi:Pkinase-domain-containing protein [Aulographum hederae CBS 113979]|uniref:non-specific serine/threonine protein kinase n=1 Tax=Aulographum hederae CBS 113979 TaxID=1176131 RepID=A0A6G1HDJ0_9PEZI|nr:Pkinase-domain-containing protein [Aulographum hederae CBS 113979]
MAENYQVLEELGSGSFGVVYKAIERSTGDLVAIKHIDLEGSDDDIREIQQEISLLSTCASPFVTQYKASFVRGVKLWIVMEYLGGGSCLDLLRPGAFNEAHIAIIMRELLLGLDYLHKTGKIHRDIKAANVLLSNTGKVKIADFGVAAQLTNIKSQRMTFVGTPFWMAPEVIQEAGYDFKADIWSLGITAMELANGEPPNASTHPMKVLFLIPKAPAPKLEGNFSKEFKDFVSCCLIKDSDKRWTAKDLLKHKFVQKAGKVEALKELIERHQEYQGSDQRPAHPKYYEETMQTNKFDRQDLSPKDEQDEWVFDTIKQATVAPTRHTSKRRKLSRIPSDPPTAALQHLDLNAAPLGTGSPAYTPQPHYVNTIRKASNTPTRRRSSAQTAVRIPSGNTPTARRVSGRNVSAQKQPLGVDMTFGNSTSTVRQFRRVSAERAREPSGGEKNQQQKAPRTPSKRLPSAQRMDSHQHPDEHIYEDENTPPAPLEQPETPIPANKSAPVVSKEALLGRRAYAKALDGAFQEAYNQTAEQSKRDALAKVAQAWSALDRVDPEGELGLLRLMFEKLGGDARVATALGLESQKEKERTAAAAAEKENQKEKEKKESREHRRRRSELDPLRSHPTASIPTTTIEESPSRDETHTPHGTASPAVSPSKHRPTSQISPSKLVLAQNNPHLKSHRRRQSAFVLGSSEMDRERERERKVLEEKKLPGYVQPGMEHAGMLQDVLYGRWLEGLKGRWGVA